VAELIRINARPPTTEMTAVHDRDRVGDSEGMTAYEAGGDCGECSWFDVPRRACGVGPALASV
jgi:hypothetical protein